MKDPDAQQGNQIVKGEHDMSLRRGDVHINLCVPWAESEMTFIKTARCVAQQVWREKHPGTHRGRGRPSQLRSALITIWEAQAAGEIGKKPTQGKLIRLIRDKINMEHPLSEKALRNYAKVWLLLQKRTKEMTKEEILWLCRRSSWRTKADVIISWEAKVLNALIIAAFKHVVQSPVIKNGKLIGFRRHLPPKYTRVFNNHLEKFDKKLVHASSSPKVWPPLDLDHLQLLPE